MIGENPHDWPSEKDKRELSKCGGSFGSLALVPSAAESRKKHTLRKIGQTLLIYGQLNTQALKEKSGLSSNAINRGLKQMRDMGLVEIQRRPYNANNEKIYSLKKERATFYVYYLYNYKRMNDEAKKNSYDHYWAKLRITNLSGVEDDGLLFFSREECIRHFGPSFAEPRLIRSGSILKDDFISVPMRKIRATLNNSQIKNIENEIIDRAHKRWICTECTERITSKLEIELQVAKRASDERRLIRRKILLVLTDIVGLEDNMLECQTCHHQWPSTEQPKVILERRFENGQPKLLKKRKSRLGTAQMRSDFGL
ncbi:MAG: helix-turn-helix domain-containing protein [Nitrososphaera sp.]